MSLNSWHKRNGATAEERFWSKVDKNGPIPSHCPELGPCWIWTACFGWGGYGRFKFNGRMIQAHHFSIGKTIPIGMFGCHKCDNKKCVRPDHIFTGTNTENLMDASIKGRLLNSAKLSSERFKLRHKLKRGAGEFHPRAKLTWSIVIAARAAAPYRGYIASMASRFGVSKVAMRNAIIGKTWSLSVESQNN